MEGARLSCRQQSRIPSFAFIAAFRVEAYHQRFPCVFPPLRDLYSWVVDWTRCWLVAVNCPEEVAALQRATSPSLLMPRSDWLVGQILGHLLPSHLSGLHVEHLSGRPFLYRQWQTDCLPLAVRGLRGLKPTTNLHCLPFRRGSLNRIAGSHCWRTPPLARRQSRHQRCPASYQATRLARHLFGWQNRVRNDGRIGHHRTS